MLERDMMYGGYYQGVPNNMAYGNFGYQGPPGSLMTMQMQPSNNDMFLNNYNDINTKLNILEKRIKNLEQKIDNNSYQDDNSLYMI